MYDEVSVSANLDVNISQQEIEDIKYYSNDEDDTGPKSSHYYYLAENTDGTGGVVGTDAMVRKSQIITCSIMQMQARL